MDEQQLQAFRTAFGFGGKLKWKGLAWEESPEEQVEKLLGKGEVARIRKELASGLKAFPNPKTLKSATKEDLEDKKWEKVTNGTFHAQGVLLQNPDLAPPNGLKGADALDDKKIEKFNQDLAAFNQRMDALASLPGKNMTKEDTYLLRAVIGMRFNVNLEGQLGGQALRRIYKLLMNLPIDHYRNNSQLGAIKRTKPKDSDNSDPPAYQNFGGIITLPVAHAKQEFSVKLDGKPVGQPVSYFDHSTLHEIGHSVDDHMKFMQSHGDKVSYGGWQDETIASAATAVRGHYHLDDKFQDLLQQALQGDVDLPDNVTDELVPLTEAVGWCAKMRLKGDQNGAWRLSSGQLEEMAINKRVIQETYKGKWRSYSLAARDDAVTSYQFRAPGEWFAEIYAAYYCGLIKRSDSRVAWFQPLVDAPWKKK
jgi:hypothetical protein